MELVHLAERITLRRGARALTLDAVAREAGISKGGVLYYFPSKDDLIQAMIDDLDDEFEENVERFMQEDPIRKGRYTRAYVNAVFLWRGRKPSEVAGIAAGLLAATANCPDLLRKHRKRSRSWQRRVEDDGMDPVLASVVAWATEGFLFLQMFGHLPISGEQDRVRKRLLAMTD
jgi:AcrR family transcriptional regulator